MGVRRTKIFVFMITFCAAALANLNNINQVYANTPGRLLIERKEDELLLPPFLRDTDGGILNVTSDHATDHTNLRSAKPGEWLEYGDSFSTPDRMGMYVQMNEGLQWVGGGVFDGKIIGGNWNTAKPEYEISMNRGWMKVWAKPSAFSGTLQIKTPKVTLTVNECVFWIMVTSMKTEVYVLSGTVKEGALARVAHQFYEWSGTPAKMEKSSEQWDFVSLEHRIAGLYPNLVKLSHQANDEWLDGDSSQKYAELRSQGWKKTDRFSPSSIEQPKK